MKTALLLIDIQNDYFPSGKMELVGSLQAAAAAARLLATFRKQSWLVYHVQHISTRPTSTFFLPGTAGIEIHPSVARCRTNRSSRSTSPIASARPIWRRPFGATRSAEFSSAG